LINDLTDPRKAKSYSGSLMRAGTLKAIVEYVFNGSRFKLLVPSENCYIVFAPNYLRCPQPSPTPGSRGQGKKRMNGAGFTSLWICLILSFRQS
jgi:staphylococcal nuclease domain-containing protein 1